MGLYGAPNATSVTFPLLACFLWFIILYPVWYVYGNIWHITFSFQITLVVLHILLQKRTSALVNILLLVLSMIGQLKDATFTTNIVQALMILGVTRG